MIFVNANEFLINLATVKYNSGLVLLLSSPAQKHPITVQTALEKAIVRVQEVTENYQLQAKSLYYHILE